MWFKKDKRRYLGDNRRPQKSVLGIIAGALIVIVAFASNITTVVKGWFKPTDEKFEVNIIPQEVKDYTIPAFSSADTNFNILILSFNPVTKCPSTNSFEFLFLQRYRTLIDQYKFPMNAQIYDCSRHRTYDNLKEGFLLDKEAYRIGVNNYADFVIWGDDTSICEDSKSFEGKLRWLRVQKATADSLRYERQEISHHLINELDTADSQYRTKFYQNSRAKITEAKPYGVTEFFFLEDYDLLSKGEKQEEVDDYIVSLMIERYINSGQFLDAERLFNLIYDKKLKAYLALYLMYNKNKDIKTIESKSEICDATLEYIRITDSISKSRINLLKQVFKNLYNFIFKYKEQNEFRKKWRSVLEKVSNILLHNNKYEKGGLRFTNLKRNEIDSILNVYANLDEFVDPNFYNDYCSRYIRGKGLENHIKFQDIIFNQSWTEITDLSVIREMTPQIFTLKDYKAICSYLDTTQLNILENKLVHEYYFYELMDDIIEPHLLHHFYNNYYSKQDFNRPGVTRSYSMANECNKYSEYRKVREPNCIRYMIPLGELESYIDYKFYELYENGSLEEFKNHYEDTECEREVYHKLLLALKYRSEGEEFFSTYYNLFLNTALKAGWDEYKIYHSFLDSSINELNDCTEKSVIIDMKTLTGKDTSILYKIEGVFKDTHTDSFSNMLVIDEVVPYQVLMDRKLF